MMKIQLRILWTVLLTFGMLFTASSLFAQERGNDSPRVSPNASVSQTIGTTVVTVTYGRPGVRDRQIFGGLVPYNEVWRTGANESTAITFSDNVMVEGESVPAGTYSLYTIPGEEEWALILNNNLSWGTEYDSSMDQVRVMAEPEDASAVEQLMIYFEDISEESGNMVIHWDEIRVPIRIEPATD